MWVMGISKHPPRAESSPWGDQFLPPARRGPRILSLPKLRQHYPALRDVGRGHVAHVADGPPP